MLHNQAGASSSPSSFASSPHCHYHFSHHQRLLKTVSARTFKRYRFVVIATLQANLVKTTEYRSSHYYVRLIIPQVS